MGKTLDALTRRNFKTTKFTSLVTLAIARLVVLKNQLQVRYRQARNDVVQLLQMGLFERALTRVEYVIRDQNMMDVYMMMENFCKILLERAYLIEQDRECPEELKEAIASLLYSSKRCGEFPELKEMCALFTNHYGKEFVARAMELRHSCGVNPEMIQKLSTRQQTDLDTRLETLKGIASENNIVLQLDEQLPPATEEDQEAYGSTPHELDSLVSDKIHKKEEFRRESFGDTIKANMTFKDAAEAAQYAFESAADAAAAAKAAVELSRFEYHKPEKQSSRKNSAKGSHSQKSEDSFEQNDFIEQNMPESGDSLRVKETYSDSESVEHDDVKITPGKDHSHVGESAAVDSNKQIPPIQTSMMPESRRDNTKRHRNIFSHIFGRKDKHVSVTSRQVSRC